MYWPGLYAPVASESLRQKLKNLINKKGALPSDYSVGGARRLFMKSRASLSLSGKRAFSRYMPSESDRIVKDEKADRIPSIFRDIHDAEFLISLRHGWLPLRTGERVILEAYNPHRCAHQFGYDQVIPAPQPSCFLLSPDIMIIGNCWSSLLRTGTGSTFVIPRAKRPIQFSATYQRCFHAALSAYHAHTPDDVAAMTCGGNNAYKGSLSFPSITKSERSCSGLDAKIDYTIKLTKPQLPR